MVCSLLCLRACSLTIGVSTQAYLWMGIYDSKHEKNVQLEKELLRTQEKLDRKRQQYSETLWTLHELSNGAAIAAINLYRAGQLQARTDYGARDRIQARIWRAEAAMNRECANEMYCRRQ